MKVVSLGWLLPLVVLGSNEELGDLLCNDRTYGRVSANAAQEVAKYLPYTNAHTHSQMESLTVARGFAEPSSYRPKFPPVASLDGHRLIQLPKIWKRRAWHSLQVNLER